MTRKTKQLMWAGFGFAWLFGLVFALTMCAAGCSGIESLPAYANVGKAVLSSELAADVTTLSDEELQDRLRLMIVVDPLTGQVRDLSSEYLAALESEMLRRGLQ